ncbi:MAG: DegT/DnrJ/EryC1/StrS family aminotransferase [Mobilitalea sp.]
MTEIQVTRSSMPEYEEYIEEIKELWDSHWLTNMGTKHIKLEEELLKYLQVPYITLFSNGHMALESVIAAFNLSGEVITTPFTFASTTHAIVRNGLKPVFCDIHPNTYVIDEEKIEALITKHTTAIIPVHLYGNICNVEKIQQIADKYKLKVIYDAAHSFGSSYKGMTVGNFGDASMFSFHATKVFNTIEGGAVSYGCKALGDKLYTLKNFGIKSQFIVDGIGANSKMNEFQAAMGICNLRHIETELQKRKKVVERYLYHLTDIDGIKLMKFNEGVQTNYSYFPVVFEEDKLGFDREYIYNKLEKEGIYARRYFYPLTSDFDCYKESYDSSLTPIAKHISERVLTLPLYSDLNLDDVDRICSIITSK